MQAQSETPPEGFDYAEAKVKADDLDCYSCGENQPAGECSKSKRPCGHHCNCSWVHDHCHWCGKEFGEPKEGDPDA